MFMMPRSPRRMLMVLRTTHDNDDARLQHARTLAAAAADVLLHSVLELSSRRLVHAMDLLLPSDHLLPVLSQHLGAPVCCGRPRCANEASGRLEKKAP